MTLHLSRSDVNLYVIEFSSESNISDDQSRQILSTMAPKEQQCGAEPLDWALFVLTIISTHVTWWLLPLPTLYKHGFRQYVHDVAWECLRLQVPSYTAFRACFGQDRTHWQSNYYSGICKSSTKFDTAKGFAKDSLIVVSTCLALYRLCSGDENKDLSGLNSSLWNYPSLPVAIFGLAISIFSKTSPAIKLWQMTLGTLTFIIIIAIVLAVIMAYTIGRGLWWPCTLLMLFMAIPLWGIPPKLIIGAVALATFGRAGGPIIGAVSPRAYFPFCEVRGWGFSGPLLALTIIGVFLAFYGTTLKPRAPEPRKVVEMEEIP